MGALAGQRKESLLSMTASRNLRSHRTVAEKVYAWIEHSAFLILVLTASEPLFR